MTKKICVICEICVTKKRPKKNLCISVKSVGQNFHRISRNFGRLANGSRQICAAIVFGHADFADDADFYSWEGLVPQISQIYTDLFEFQANRFVRSQGVSATTEQVASAKFRE